MKSLRSSALAVSGCFPFAAMAHNSSTLPLLIAGVVFAQLGLVVSALYIHRSSIGPFGRCLICIACVCVGWILFGSGIGDTLISGVEPEMRDAASIAIFATFTLVLTAGLFWGALSRFGQTRGH
jgi:hypothetical protein